MTGGSSTNTSTASQLGLRIMAQSSDGDQWYGTGERFKERTIYPDGSFCETTYEWCKKLPKNLQ